MSPPLPTTRLQQIATDACNIALEHAESYTHSNTERWNTTIINRILESLISESSSGSSSGPPFKFAVNSTIIQHLQPSSQDAPGRRGMHSATGAYWNNERDGMWSFKYEGGEKKGMDVVVNLVWIAL